MTQVESVEPPGFELETLRTKLEAFLSEEIKYIRNQNDPYLSFDLDSVVLEEEFSNLFPNPALKTYYMRAYGFNGQSEIPILFTLGQISFKVESGLVLREQGG
jgi:hypothetical protein